jgi:hypothetical protein
MKWENDGERFPTITAQEGDIIYNVSSENYKGPRFWWYAEIGNGNAGEADYPTIEAAMKAVEDFAPKLQAFLDSLKGESP